MKKAMSLFLALTLALALTACGGNNGPSDSPETDPSAGASSGEASSAPEIKEVTVSVPAFSILVNGAEVTHETMAGYAVYEIRTTTVNSVGTESAVTYTGFALSDVLAAAGVSGYTSVTAAADDGYTVEVSAEVAGAPTTLVAIEKDGVPFSVYPWFAPCSSGVTGDYLKNMAAIALDGAAPQLPGEGGEGGGDGLPEILDRTDKVQFGQFSFLVNGAEVTNATLEGLHIYKIDAVTTNSRGETSASTYTGYRLSDVLAACGVTGYTSVKAVANDGYETELTPDSAGSEYTLLAIEKDKETGEDGTVWVAPCLEGSSKAYCKLVVEIVAE